MTYRYKRNQIEQAIARLVDPNCQDAPEDLRTRIKRLLEIDRAEGRNVRSKNAEQVTFGFFSDEAPGSGADVLFSEYEAFALANAVNIMAHRWPASFAVSILRRVRPDLEKEHGRTLLQDPEQLFDEKAIRERARPGALAVTNTDPVFLVLVSRMDTGEAQTAPLSAVCHGPEKVGAFLRAIGPASTVTLLEVVTLAHLLHQKLLQTQAKRRGRG